MGTIGRVVIVGAGQSGGWVAKSLRDRGYAGDIILFGNEIWRPYERPPLSKGFLSGAVEPDALKLFSDDIFDSLRLDFRPSTKVVAIDRAARTVVTAGGTQEPYDRLVLATGGRPREIANLTGRGVFKLRTIEDALAIKAALDAATKVVVIGGGWIGLEIAAAARKVGVAVRLIEMAERLCARAAPPELSKWLYELHVNNGVDIEFGRSVDAVPDDCDITVVGAGLVANDEIAAQSGLETDNGILTDACGRTRDNSVFACGDVARFAVPGADQPIRLESWSNAQNQAIACAGQVLGMDASPRETPWFWSDQYDANIQIIGLPPSDRPAIRRGALDARSFSLFWTQGGRMAAAIAINAPNDIKVARRLIERDVPVSDDRLADLSVPIKKLLTG